MEAFGARPKAGAFVNMEDHCYLRCYFCSNYSAALIVLCSKQLSGKYVRFSGLNWQVGLKKNSILFLLFVRALSLYVSLSLSFIQYQPLSSLICSQCMYMKLHQQLKDIPPWRSQKDERMLYLLFSNFIYETPAELRTVLSVTNHRILLVPDCFLLLEDPWHNMMLQYMDMGNKDDLAIRFDIFPYVHRVAFWRHAHRRHLAKYTYEAICAISDYYKQTPEREILQNGRERLEKLRREAKKRKEAEMRELLRTVMQLVNSAPDPTEPNNMMLPPTPPPPPPPPPATPTPPPPATSPPPPPPPPPMPPAAPPKPNNHHGRVANGGTNEDEAKDDNTKHQTR